VSPFITSTLPNISFALSVPLALETFGKQRGMRNMTRRNASLRYLCLKSWKVEQAMTSA